MRLYCWLQKGHAVREVVENTMVVKIEGRREEERKKMNRNGNKFVGKLFLECAS